MSGPAKEYPALDTLEAVLRRLDAAHRKLLGEADLKRKAIVEGDLAGLEAIVGRERALVDTVRREEGRRLAAARVARQALGLPEAQGKLSDLTRAAGEPWAGRLETLRARLREALTALRAKVRLNQELLKASLDHVAGFLGSLREANGARPTYTARAQKAQSGGRPLMDTSA